ncbi:MAG TPA: sialidase family protein [Acidimicrobiales bacterium]|nr:sialidase family protein [Acidimicrobiales bacterium]
MVGPRGQIFLAAQFQPVNCATGDPEPGTAYSCVWTSTDEGNHWHVIGGEPGRQAGDDVDLARPAGSNALILSGMADEEGTGTGTAETTVSRTTDGGRHWTEAHDANHTAVNDRPFLLDAGNHDLLLTFAAVPGNIEAVRSTDDGASFGAPILVTPVPPQLVLSVNGGPVYDRARHQLVVPYASSSNPGCTSAPNACFNQIGLARSSDDGHTWTQERIATLPANEGLNSEFDVAADAKGREYAVLAIATGTSPFAPPTGQTEVWFTTSAGPGKPWSRLARLPGGSGMLPWVVAAGDGNVGIAWYASASSNGETASVPWVVEAAVSHDGGRKWSVGGVSDHVVYGGSGYTHQPVVWDLLGLAFDSHGMLNVAWGDVGDNATGPAGIEFSRQIR